MVVERVSAANVDRDWRVLAAQRDEVILALVASVFLDKPFGFV